MAVAALVVASAGVAAASWMQSPLAKGGRPTAPGMARVISTVEEHATEKVKDDRNGISALPFDSLRWIIRTPANDGDALNSANAEWQAYWQAADGSQMFMLKMYGPRLVMNTQKEGAWGQ